jgi:hypothetical protein
MNMLSPEEKLKRMMVFGKIEIRHSQYTDEFHIWLPIKLRPVSAPEYIVDLNAVGNDIYGKTINEAIDKMFTLLTSDGLWIQPSSGGRFRYYNGTFRNKNEIPVTSPISNTAESRNKTKFDINKPWYKRAVQQLNLPSKTTLLAELIIQKIDSNNPKEKEEIQKEIELLQSDDGDQRFEDLMNDYIIRAKGWTIDEEGFIKEFDYLKEKKREISPVFNKLVSILGGTTPNAVVKPSSGQKRFIYTEKNTESNRNKQTTLHKPQQVQSQSEKQQEEYDWEYYEKQHQIDKMEYEDWLAKEEMAQSSYEDDLRYLERVEDGEE